MLIITAYNTVFGGSGTPNGFEYIVAIDCTFCNVLAAAQRCLCFSSLTMALDCFSLNLTGFLDRCITALNVTGDTVVSCIIAQNVPLTELEGLHVDDSKATKRIAEGGSFDDSSDNKDETMEG